jgi:hypothetical protein
LKAYEAVISNQEMEERERDEDEDDGHGTTAL